MKLDIIDKIGIGLCIIYAIGLLVSLIFQINYEIPLLIMLIFTIIWFWLEVIFTARELDKEEE